MDDSYRAALRGNITKLYLLKASVGAMMFIPVIVPFFLANGLTVQQIFIVEAIYAFATATFELPSGYLSDRWTRKNTLVIGAFGFVLSIIVFTLGTSFWAFALAEVLIAFGISCFSGTIDALTYDTLLELGETDDYRRIQGHQQFLFFGSEAVTSILAGLLALVHLRAPVVATLVPYSLGFLVALSLVEPKRHKLDSQQHLAMIWNICQDTVLHKPALRYIILLGGVLSMLGMTLFWFRQPFQIEYALPLALFGVVHAGLAASGALAAKYTHRLHRVMPDKNALILFAGMTLITYVGIGFTFSLWALLFFIFMRVAWSGQIVITTDLINRMTTSDRRATTLSIAALFRRLLFAIGAPWFGYFGDVLSINHAILATGLIGAACVGLAFFGVRSVWGQIPK